MANPVLGKSLCSDWFFLGQDFAVRTVSKETIQSVYFCFGAKLANSKFATKTAEKRCEYCRSSASVMAARTSLRSVRTATTSGQYSPVRPLRSVSKRLVL